MAEMMLHMSNTCVSKKTFEFYIINQLKQKYANNIYVTIKVAFVCPYMQDILCKYARKVCQHVDISNGTYSRICG